MDGEGVGKILDRLLHRRNDTVGILDQCLARVQVADEQELGNRLGPIGTVQLADLLELADRILPLAEVVQVAAVIVQACQPPALGDEIGLDLRVRIAAVDRQDRRQFGGRCVPVLCSDGRLGRSVPLSQRLLPFGAAEPQPRLGIIRRDFQQFLEGSLRAFVVPDRQPGLAAIVQLLGLPLGRVGPGQPALECNQQQRGDADNAQQDQPPTLPVADAEARARDDRVRLSALRRGGLAARDGLGAGCGRLKLEKPAHLVQQGIQAGPAGLEFLEPGETRERLLPVSMLVRGHPFVVKRFGGIGWRGGEIARPAADLAAGQLRRLTIVGACHRV